MKQKKSNVFVTILKVIGLLLLILFLSVLLANIQLKEPENLAKGFSGDTDDCGIMDIYGLYDDKASALKTVDSAVKDCSEELGLYITVYLAGESDRYRSDTETENFSHALYNEIYGENTDGVLYYLDISGKRPAYDFISTSGKAWLMYEDHIDEIFNYLDRYLPSSGQPVYESQITEAINAFCAELRTLSKSYRESSLAYEHDTIASPDVYVYMKDGETYVTESPAPGVKFRLYLLANSAGALIAAIFYAVTKHRYKFKSSANPSVYVSQKHTRFNEKSDTLIRSYVTKHKIESSGGGGGRGGGGSHHSGGHGGGGHHR